MSDFNPMVLNPRTLWVTIADEIGDRAARGEAPVEIARVLRVSVAKVRRVLEMGEMA